MSNIKIGITQGDINGISYEVILKTLEDNRICELCTPIVYGSPKVAAYQRKMLNLNVNLNLVNKPEEAEALRHNTAQPYFRFLLRCKDRQTAPGSRRYCLCV